MNETLVTDRHLVAELSDEEYMRLRVMVAQAQVTLKQWVGQAIREKLEKKEKR